jgi:hypothetical protein
MAPERETLVVGLQVPQGGRVSQVTVQGLSTNPARACGIGVLVNEPGTAVTVEESLVRGADVGILAEKGASLAVLGSEVADANLIGIGFQRPGASGVIVDCDVHNVADFGASVWAERRVTDKTFSGFTSEVVLQGCAIHASGSVTVGTNDIPPSGTAIGWCE